jgi:hypothetical protein
MIYKHSQKKYPFARRKIRRGGLAKKGSRQGRKKSLCGFATLRLREKKNPPRRTCKEEKTQRLRPLCGFATLRLCVKKKIRRGGPAKKKRRKEKPPLRLGTFARA